MRQALHNLLQQIGIALDSTSLDNLYKVMRLDKLDLWAVPVVAGTLNAVAKHLRDSSFLDNLLDTTEEKED
jgi:hypothetical protein